MDTRNEETNIVPTKLPMDSSPEKIIPLPLPVDRKDLSPDELETLGQVSEAYNKFLKKHEGVVGRNYFGVGTSELLLEAPVRGKSEEDYLDQAASYYDRWLDPAVVHFLQGKLNPEQYEGIQKTLGKARGIVGLSVENFKKNPLSLLSLLPLRIIEVKRHETDCPDELAGEFLRYHRIPPLDRSRDYDNGFNQFLANLETAAKQTYKDTWITNVEKLGQTYRDLKREILEQKGNVSTIQERVEGEIEFLWPYNLAFRDGLLKNLHDYAFFVNQVNRAKDTWSVLSLCRHNAGGFQFVLPDGKTIEGGDILYPAREFIEMIDYNRLHVKDIEEHIDAFPEIWDLKTKARELAYDRLSQRERKFADDLKAVESAETVDKLMDSLRGLSNLYLDYKDVNGDYWNSEEMVTELWKFRENKPFSIDVFPSLLRTKILQERSKRANQNSTFRRLKTRLHSTSPAGGSQ